MVNVLENLDAGIAYGVTVIAINKKGASPAVYKTVETLQRPELQLIEEKIPVQAEMGDSELVLTVFTSSGHTFSSGPNAHAFVLVGNGRNG